MLQIDNQVVKSLDKLTILVVNIDEKLTFIEHIKDINRKASQKEGVLLRLHNLIPCTLQWYKVNLLKANPRKYQIIAIYRTPFVR